MPRMRLETGERPLRDVLSETEMKELAQEAAKRTIEQESHDFYGHGNDAGDELITLGGVDFDDFMLRIKDVDEQPLRLGAKYLQSPTGELVEATLELVTDAHLEDLKGYFRWKADDVLPMTDQVRQEIVDDLVMGDPL